MLRKRKNKLYKETNDEDCDGERKFDLTEALKTDRFDQAKDRHLNVLSGHEVNLKRFQRDGFDKPILVSKPEGLDLRVPPKSFQVRDVRDSVGPQRTIDVMDVKTQKNIEMSLRDWCKYYESRYRDRLLNVISLEFSHTGLDEMVESPSIVKNLDWVDLVWPKSLKESQTEGTNSIDQMKYPKVQKYCLMSVKGSYTDFHIDFGGTSVWYHILRGRKIFWMVPPTELNLQVFEDWTLSGHQQHVFFGDTVEDCFKVELRAGNTFFIPSGWMHAVYTLEDSLVFGGNFLHSLSIENQLRVSKIEDATKVPVKFRYPFYTELLWYVVQHYVFCLTGKDHLNKIESPSKSSGTYSDSKNNNNNNKSLNEDESTESEYEISDNNGAKGKKQVQPRASAKRHRGKSTKKVAKKKRTEPPTDDESTDIDSANEEHKETSCKPSTTCRMTKNSLTRLQYDVSEAGALGAGDNVSVQTKKSIKDPALLEDKSNSKRKVDNVVTKEQMNRMNLADMMVMEESKLNGWSRGVGGHSIWSNPTADNGKSNWIHITRYEINGLKALIKHLGKLSGAKKNMPTLIRNSRSLLDDCRKMLNEHENDDPELAVSGKPITPELLKTRESDMNELIGQFFKKTESSKSELPSKSESLDQSSSQHPDTSNTQSVCRPKAKVETSIPETGKNERRSSRSDNHSTQASPQKDKGSNSPTKSKVTSSVNHPTSTETIARPQSPPTRPISNNQYKTRNDNDLPLPGSFADLIAATSTEKKIFDINGSDMSSSYYKVQSSKPVSDLNKSLTCNINDLMKPSKSHSTSASSATELMNSISPLPKLSPNKASSGSPDIKKELPGPTPQKRYINPSYKPQSKERLIYASAPYVSPVENKMPSSATSACASTTNTSSSAQQAPPPLPQEPRLSWTQPPQTAQTYPSQISKSSGPISSGFAPTKSISTELSMKDANLLPKIIPIPKVTSNHSSITKSKASVSAPPKSTPSAITTTAATTTSTLSSSITSTSSRAPASTYAIKPSSAKPSINPPKAHSTPSSSNQPSSTIHSNPSRQTSRSTATTNSSVRIGLVSQPPLATTAPSTIAQFTTTPVIRPLFSPTTIATHPILTTAGQNARPILITTAPTRPIQAGALPVVRPLQGLTTPVSASKSSQADNAALLSLATTALSIAPTMINSTAPSQLAAMRGVAFTAAQPQFIMSNPATAAAAFANQSAGLLAGQHLFNPFLPRIPMAQYAVARPGFTSPLAMSTTTAPTAPRPNSQLVFARLPTQPQLPQPPVVSTQQPRFLITPPGYVLAQLRFMAPNLASTVAPPVTTAPPRLTLAAFKPPTSEQQAHPKVAIKTKKGL